ncbi:MAG: lasso peptide biosynthesis B2 protein [Candidatus Schekmanbacteria bacterium]|nr:lasso peptide biosynthesis B2 protein [Candidatus Schekmanbacteria bacterium]
MNRLSLLITNVILFFKIFLLVLALPLLLKSLSLPRLLKLLTPRKKKKMDDRVIERILKITDSILGIRFFVFTPSCLRKSLLLYHLLNRYGMKVKIHFAVKKDDGKLDGHSWLTKNGKRVYDYLESVDDFSITYTYPEED